MIELVELFKPKTDNYHCIKCGTEFIFVDIYNKPCLKEEIDIINIKCVVCKTCRESRDIFWDNQGNLVPIYHKEVLRLCNPHTP